MSLLPMAASGSRQRILLVRFGAMGDIIQTLPAVADLRQGLPDIEVVWAVDRRWWELLEGNPHVDELVDLPLRQLLNPRACTNEGVGETLMRLRAKRFDLALDMQGLLKSAAVAAACNAKAVAGLSHHLLREPHAALLYDRRIEASSVHVVDRYRELAQQATGQQPRKACFSLPPGEPKGDLPERFVLTSPLAGWGAKQWPQERYSALAERLWGENRVPLVVDCGPGQEAYARAIRIAVPDGAVLVHRSTISQLIGATRRATAVLGVDSGPLHMAAALGRPGVAIFGPTDPVRNGPYGSSIAVLRMADAETTYKRSPDPSPSMQAWSAEAVYRKLVPLLNSVD